MSNRLSMAQTQAIQALAATGQSNRAISRALGVDRGTVAKTLSQIQNQPPVWEAPTGSGDAPAGFQDADQVAESGSTQVAESDAETCSGQHHGRLHHRLLMALKHRLVPAASVSRIVTRSCASWSRV